MKIAASSTTKSARVLAKISALTLLICTFHPSAKADVSTSRTPLKGQVEDTDVLPTKQENLAPQVPMAVPVPPKKLQGNVEKVEKKPLQGNADDEDSDLKGMSGRADNAKPLSGRADDGVLKARVEDGTLAAQDPDVADQELMVEWDKWRNRFLWAVQSGVQEILNNSDDSSLRWDPRRQTIVRQFPLGTEAWFHCQIRSDRKIVNFKLIHSSGYPNYDKAVEDAVGALQDSAILRFPGKSRRERVTQDAGIKTAETSQPEFFHFGDVEKYRVPGGGN